MKNIYLILLLFITSLSLSAQEKEKDTQSILDKLLHDNEMLNVMLDTRIDLQSTVNNDDGIEDATFRGQTFKLWFVGEIVPGIRYRVRHRLNKPQTPSREGYSGATDQAWLAFDIGEKWTITAGKQSVQFGTFEYDYNPADVYMATTCFNDLDAYKTGVNAAYRFLGQTINLQVINSDSPQFAHQDYKNKAFAANVLWEGSLFGDVVKTRWAYGAFQHTKDKFYNWLTVGTQFNAGKFTTEIDYYLGSYNMDYSSVVGDATLGQSYIRDQSLLLNFKYNFGKWQPSVKGSWNQRYDKDFDKKAYSDLGAQAIVEWFPFEGRAKNLRFHAMYSYNDTKFEGNYSDLKNKGVHAFLIGTRWLFKVK